MVSIIVNWDDLVILSDFSEATQESMAEVLSHAKSEIAGWNPDTKELKIDIKTSNRPDLWSVEGLARDIKGMLKKDLGIPTVDSYKESKVQVFVSSAVRNVRPYFAGFTVSQFEMTDSLIRQMVQLSEKIDLSYGRKRSKTSIGLYDMDLLTPPYHYGLKAKTEKFVPLGYQREMSLEKILEDHPKGKEYGHIFTGLDMYPLIYDSQDNVLSMPPIINSAEAGQITAKTSNLFVEITGTNEQAVNTAINVLAQAFLDRGGDVKSIQICYLDETDSTVIRQVETPQTTFESIDVSASQINKRLGTNFSAHKIASLLLKKRYNTEIIPAEESNVKKEQLTKDEKEVIRCYLPPYRGDVIHWVDVSEDVAIAYEYKNFKAQDPQLSTTGSVLPKTKVENSFRLALIGAGLQEVLTYTLSSKENLFDNMHYDSSQSENEQRNREKQSIAILNPVSHTYSIIRDFLTPQLLQFLAKNKHHSYPQWIFEVGEVASINSDGIPLTQTNAAIALVSSKETFGNCHSILDKILSSYKIEYELKAHPHPWFIEGRGAEIWVNQQKIGFIGEFHPRIILNWELALPIAGFEIELDKIQQVNTDFYYTYKPSL